MKYVPDRGDVAFFHLIKSSLQNNSIFAINMSYYVVIITEFNDILIHDLNHDRIRLKDVS